jgi:GTP-binding protein Era
VQKENIAKTIAAYAAEFDFEAVVPLSAKNGKGIDILLSECEKLLYEGEFIFPEDMITDQPERLIAAEIIREKLLRTLDEEIPHGTAVSIEDWSEKRGVVSIRAEIYCEKASHKGIIIGKGGAMLKKISSASRVEMEDFFGCKIFLKIFVKVKENWRDSEIMLKNFGYSDRE